MRVALVLLLVVAGLVANLAAGGLLVQPDWALALLLAALLGRRRSWPWVLPAVFVHDLALHWHAAATFPAFAILPPLLAWLDGRLGAALPHRVALLLLATTPLLWLGWGPVQWLLTLTLCVPLWHLLVHRSHAQPA